MDTVNNEIAVANDTGSITVYSRTASGNIAPLRMISGASTGLNGPTGIAVDTVNDEIIVANSNNNSLTVFTRTTNGNVAPLRTISGASTGLNAPYGVAIDTVNNEIAVANYPFSSSVSITVHNRSANGNVAPLRTIAGGNTGLGSLGGIALTP